MKNKEVFDLVAEVGVLMLSGSGEVGRARDTLSVMAKSFGIREFKCYLISNGLFLSGIMEEDRVEVRIEEVPMGTTNLYLVENLNRLSRRVSMEHMRPEDVKKEVDKIKNTQPYTFWETALASAFGCAAFCYFFKGSIADTLYTLPVGFILWCFLGYAENKTKAPKIVNNLFASVLVTCLACIGVVMGLADSVDKVVIGAVMPLVPGVPFVNAIRNFFSNDYLSGVVRMADAFLTALSVGVGVGVSIIIWNSLIGGVIIW